MTFILSSTIEKMVKDKLHSGIQSSAVSTTPVCLPKCLCSTRRKKCSAKFLTGGIVSVLLPSSWLQEVQKDGWPS